VCVTIHWDGSQFGVDEWETHGDKKSLWHEAWIDITPTSFTQTGDVQGADGRSTRLFTIHGTKVADSGPQ
jgi:hypothetical protein